MASASHPSREAAASSSRPSHPRDIWWQCLTRAARWPRPTSYLLRRVRRVSLMLRWTDLSQIPQGYGPSVVTMGNFDGVHKGHRAVLATVMERARNYGSEGSDGAHGVAVTFDPHPVAVLHPERAPQIITSSEQRLDLLAATGLDAVLVMEFTRDLALWTPEHFVVEVFVKALGARVVVVGEDTRFGVRNSGNVDTMRRLGAEHGFEVLALTDIGEGGRWSSSRVRGMVTSGDVAWAAEILGRPHRVSGEVVHGDHRGRELGYPTANLSQESAGLIPADGVYVGRLIRPKLPDRDAVSYTHLRAHETRHDLVCRLLLE